MSLLADYNLPFALAAGAVLLLALLQVIGLGDFGVDADFDLDGDADIVDPSSAGIGGAITTLLGLGKVPLFIWLIVFLLLFTVIGMSLQGLAADLTGAPLYPWLAAVFSAMGSLPVTAVLVRPLARIIPQDETSAVGLDSLVGRRGIVTTGRAAKGSPARTRVHDRHGQAHHVMVEPHEDASEMLEGDEVLLVRRDGQLFFGVATSERKLAPMDR